MNVSKLSIDGSGRATGTCPNGKPVRHNSPWPCPNGISGGMGSRAQIRGFIPHTMVGGLEGTLSLFDRSGFDASAHFCIGDDGQIVQMGPVGPGRFKAYAEAAGNLAWFSAESSDGGNPNRPYTTAQLWALAQLAELLSRPTVGNFPLQVTNSTGGLGIGVHNMGGSAWGGHSCPDLPPRHVRSNQRGQIIDFARQLRGSGPGHKPPPPPQFKLWTSEGMLPLGGLAGQLHTTPAVMAAMTAEHGYHDAMFAPLMVEYVNAVFDSDDADMGKGLVWHYPAGRADKEWTTDPGSQPLHALAAQLGTGVSTILRMTCERSKDGLFQGAVLDYVNGVFSRSEIHVPHGTVLAYP
jgi:N-acetylmuramoyl-L-alanine amidase-like protein